MQTGSIAPYGFYFQPINNNPNIALNNAVVAMPAPVYYAPYNYQYALSYAFPMINKPKNIVSDFISNVNHPILKEALNKLNEVKYLPGDAEYIKNMGINLIFNNGEEALKTALNQKINIKFGEVINPKAHAQWDNINNFIVINDKYKDSKDPAVILAISEAIFHELGHAKDNDFHSSVQEELECLALNTLAFRYHNNKYSEVFKNSQNADIINDGVAKYAKLFFDTDIDKKALVDRVIEKYGDLPLESPNHKAPIAALVLNKLK